MDIYKTLETYINQGDLERSVTYSIKCIKNKELSIVDLYQDVLANILNAIDCDQTDEECIWFEHQRTAIVRNIIDALFPYLIEQKEPPRKEKVLVVCPSEEYHEIGAKMAADFFYLLGYQTTFVGANTPQKTIASAVKTMKPTYVALGVTNYYNLVTAKRIVEEIREIDPHIRVLAGGRAFTFDGAKETVDVDQLVFTYQDIKALKEQK